MEHLAFCTVIGLRDTDYVHTSHQAPKESRDKVEIHVRKGECHGFSRSNLERFLDLSRHRLDAIEEFHSRPASNFPTGAPSGDLPAPDKDRLYQLATRLRR